MTALSILDLIMIGEDRTFSDSLDHARQFAQCAEKAGYARYWVAEHHNMPGIASAATTLIMSHLAAGTSSIRIGSGGVMLPNHAPFVVAEHFATLNALYPGRIDLGTGRAPGSSSPTVLAIRGSHFEQREFSDDVRSLLGYLENSPALPVRNLPGKHDVPVWILGSGLYGARLAGQLGLPFAFASHFAPRYVLDAAREYRENFRPSATLSSPYLVVGACVFAADTHEEAEYLASSHQNWVANLHSGKPGLLPRPSEGLMSKLPEALRATVEQELACSAIGDKERVGQWLSRFAKLTGADEIMIDSRIYDPQARCRSFEIAATALSA